MFFDKFFLNYQKKRFDLQYLRAQQGIAVFTFHSKCVQDEVRNKLSQVTIDTTDAQCRAIFDSSIHVIPPSSMEKNKIVEEAKEIQERTKKISELANELKQA